MNLETIKQLGVEYLTKVLQNEQIVALFQNEKVLQTLSKGLELKSKVQDEVEQRLKSVQESFSIAGIDEVRAVERRLQKLEKKFQKGVDTLKDDVKEQLGRFEEIQEGVEGARGDVEECREDVRHLDEDYSGFKTSQEDKVSTLKGNVQHTEKKIKGVTKRLDGMNERLLKIEDLVKKTTASVEQLMQADLKMKLQETKDVLLLKYNTLDQLIKKEVKNLQGSVESVKSELVAVATKPVPKPAKKSVKKSAPKKAVVTSSEKPAPKKRVPKKPATKKPVIKKDKPKVEEQK